MKVRTYSDKWFHYSLMVMASIFGIFYSKFVNCSDIALHTLASKALLFQDVGFDQSNARFPTHAFTYPIYHFIQKMVHVLLNIDYEPAAALVLSLAIIASALLYKKLALMIVEDTVVNKYWADFFSLGAVWFEVARCSINGWRYYRTQCGPNPFHNPTILFVRPLAIASFIFFLRLKETYKTKANYKYVLLFGVMTLISVGAKPSYAITFLPAMGIYTLVYMIRNKELKFGIVAFLSVLPSLVLLLIQQTWVTSNTEALNVYVKFGFFQGFEELTAWWEVAREVIMASVVTFPVVILLFRINWLKKDAAYFIGILALVFGWVQMYFLKSGRQGDFSWGYDLAVQFATFISLAETRNGEKNGKLRILIHYVAYLIFAYQVYTGLKYFWIIYTTNEFWI